MLDSLDRPDSPVTEEAKDHLAHQDLLDQPDSLDTQDRPDSPVNLEKTDSDLLPAPDPRDHPDLLVIQEVPANLEPQDTQEAKDHPDLLDNPASLDTPEATATPEDLEETVFLEQTRLTVLAHHVPPSLCAATNTKKHQFLRHSRRNIFATIHQNPHKILSAHFQKHSYTAFHQLILSFSFDLFVFLLWIVVIILLERSDIGEKKMIKD